MQRNHSGRILMLKKVATELENNTTPVHIIVYNACRFRYPVLIAILQKATSI